MDIRQLDSTTINQFFAQLPEWNIEELTGYKPVTTYYRDFSIADVFYLNGMEPESVMDTHNRAWPALKSGFLGVKGLTEYIMVLNWKIHEHYEAHRQLAQLYNKLWQETDDWAMENLTGDDLDYYLATTD